MFNNQDVKSQVKTVHSILREMLHRQAIRTLSFLNKLKTAKVVFDALEGRQILQSHHHITPLTQRERLIQRPVVSCDSCVACLVWGASRLHQL